MATAALREGEEKGIWRGVGEAERGVESEGASGGEDRGAAEGDILIASAVMPTSWSDGDCSAAGARSREQWRRKATEGVRGWAGLAGLRLS